MTSVYKALNTMYSAFTNVFSVLVLLLSAVSAGFAQQEEMVYLIVRSDDMGFSHSANLAMIETIDSGLTTSVEIMVPTPWFPEAVKMLQDRKETDIGIHLTLTSEWENMKWRPLTGPGGLTNEDGYFYPMIWPNDRYGADQALKEQNWTLAEVEAEWRAQIETALRHLPSISHLTGHMGCSDMTPEVKQLFLSLAKEYDLDIHPDEYGTMRARYQGPADTPQQKRAGFIEMLKTLTPGTHLFVDHPAYDTPEVQAIHHTGYEDVAQDRQGVTDLLTDPEIKQLVQDLNIKLISYKDLTLREQD